MKDVRLMALLRCVQQERMSIYARGAASTAYWRRLDLRASISPFS